ncbi:MAG: hypothetical protein Salg2KO_04930 [Salibacteraceae bacterium]
MKALNLFSLILFIGFGVNAQILGIPQVDHSFSKYIQTEKQDSGGFWDTVVVAEQTILTDDQISSQRFTGHYEHNPELFEAIGQPNFFPQIQRYGPLSVADYRYNANSNKLDTAIIRVSQTFAVARIYSYSDSSTIIKEAFMLPSDTFVVGQYVDIHNTNGQITHQFYDSNLIRRMEYTESGKIKLDRIYPNGSNPRDSTVYKYDENDVLIEKNQYWSKNGSQTTQHLFQYHDDKLVKQERFRSGTRDFYYEFDYDNRDRIIERRHFNVDHFMDSVDVSHIRTVNYDYDIRGKLIEVVSEAHISSTVTKHTLIFNTPLGVQEALANSAVSIYPNPTTGRINIVHEGGIESVEVMDMNGALLRKASLIPSEMDISDLPNGIYFLRLKAESGMQTKKVVKQ